ncbi:hypothetical protein BDZ97DRAFT_1922790 [Flammula alnicola]|nr:hypothetical protein BDZ97DRAFT_1922790 [Flammula alnicola]
MYLIHAAVEKRMTVDRNFLSALPEDSSWRWLREDLCLLWATRLDDEAIMQAAVARLFMRVTQASPKAKNIVYGIVISLFHIVIVRVDLGVSEGSFKHTAALQFLPSFYAKSPSTPGISAAVRLGYALLCRDLEHLPDSPTYFGEHRNPESVVGTIPTEIWTSIAGMLYRPADLIRLSLISRQSKLAVERIFLYPLLWEDLIYRPWLPGLRLVESAKTNVPNAMQVVEGRGMDSGGDDGPDNSNLSSAAFKIDSDQDLGDGRRQFRLWPPSPLPFKIVCEIQKDILAFSEG